MKILGTLAISSLVLASGVAGASDIQLEENIATTAVANPYALRLEAGLGGYGAAVEYATSDKVSVEVGFSKSSAINVLEDEKIEGAEYDVDFIPEGNAFLALNYRPFSNWFYLTTGVLWQDNSIELLAENAGANNTITINNNDYTLSSLGDITAEVTYKNEFGPYLGIGFSPSISNNWGVFGQIGVAYMGDLESNISSTKASSDPVTAVVNGKTIATTETVGSVLSKAKKEIDDEIDDAPGILPMAKIGIVYRF